MPQPHAPITPDDAPREPNTGRSFREKLGIYLTGVAIGIMFFGWIQYRKGQSARLQRAQQADQQEPLTADPVTQDPSNQASPATTEPSPG